MVLVSCNNCGKKKNVPPSRLKKGRGKYCSRECRYEIELKANRVCLTCKKEFHVSPSSLEKKWNNFCSTTCLEASRPKTQITCRNCDKVMIVSLKRINANRGKFCSKRCFYDSQITRTLLICEVCKKEYSLRPSEAKNRRFCSEPCMGISMTTSIDIECKICGVHFKEKPSRIRNGKGKTCSRKCSDKYRTQTAIDEFYKRVNYDYTQIRGKTQFDSAWSSNIKKRDKKCKVCGDNVKDAHHIFLRRFYPLLRFSQNNGIGLCELCHCQAHGQRLL